MPPTLPTSPHDPHKPADYTGQMAAWGIALSFAYSVGGMALLGWALQRWVFPSSAPWLLIGCLAAGLVGGTYRFIKEALRANRS